MIGDYELREHLPRSLMADTFGAIHRPTGTPRVLYLLRPSAMQDAALVQRAAWEVEAARRVRHPAVPVVDPFGESADHRLYLAVERRIGQSLGAMVSEQGRLDAGFLVRIAARVVEALDAAHAVGLVHGELTPESILLGAPDPRGRRDVSLLGLGTSVVTGGVIEVDDFVYLSPERVKRATLDPRADIFSLASVLQYALEGEPPETVVGRRSARERWAVPDERIDRDSAAGVIAYARSANPDARYPSVKTFWEELVAALVRAPSVEPPRPWVAPVPDIAPNGGFSEVIGPRLVVDTDDAAFDGPEFDGPAPDNPTLPMAAPALAALASFMRERPVVVEPPVVQALPVVQPPVVQPPVVQAPPVVAPAPVVVQAPPPVVSTPVEVPVPVAVAPVAPEPVAPPPAPPVVEAPVVVAPVVVAPVVEAPAVEVPVVEAPAVTAPVLAPVVVAAPPVFAPAAAAPLNEAPAFADSRAVNPFLAEVPTAARVEEPVYDEPAEVTAPTLQPVALVEAPTVVPAVAPAVATVAAPVAPINSYTPVTSRAPSAPVAPAAPTPARARVPGQRRVAVGVVAAGLIGVAGLAYAFGRPSAPSTIKSPERPSEGAEKPVAVAPSAPVTPAPSVAATPVAPTPAAPTPAPKPEAQKPAETEPAKPAVSVPNIPRMATIAVPNINVVPTATAPREIVRADEFASLSSRKGADSSAPRAAATEASPSNLAAARREAERAVQAFANALSARDMGALRRAAPDMPASARARWATLFREAVRIRAEMTVIDVQTDGNEIAARVRNQIDVLRPGAAVPERLDAPSMALLVRDSTGWRLSTAP